LVDAKRIRTGRWWARRWVQPVACLWIGLFACYLANIVHTGIDRVVRDLKLYVESGIIHGRVQAWSGVLPHRIEIHMKYGVKLKCKFCIGGINVYPNVFVAAVVHLRTTSTVASSAIPRTAVKSGAIRGTVTRVDC
jgi:hypothetical protein